MTEYQDLVTRLRAEATRKGWTAHIMSDGTTVVHLIMRDSSYSLEHAAISHDMMVEQIETLTRERDDLFASAQKCSQKLSVIFDECDAYRALLREAGEALKLLSGGQVFDDDSGSIEVFLDVDDIRRARDVLARIKEAVE